MTPGPRFATHDEVVVLRGSRKGSHGTVERPTPFYPRHFDVRFGDGYVRPLHEDFLRGVDDVPAAAESDDDILSPLRRTTCP